MDPLVPSHAARSRGLPVLHSPQHRPLATATAALSLALLASAWAVPVASAEPPPTLICSATETASGGCIDILTRLPDELRWYTGTIPLPDGDYVVHGAAYDGRLPAASGPTGALAHYERTTVTDTYISSADSPVYYVARFNRNDALAQWVVPFYAAETISVARGPGGTIYVLAYTHSSRWPDAPMSAADYLPDERAALVVLASDGSVVLAKFAPVLDGLTSYRYQGLVATDSRGNLITQEDGGLVRRNLDSLLAESLGAVSAGTTFLDGGFRPEVVSQTYLGDSRYRINVWRRDDFAVVAAFTLPAELSAHDVVRRGDSELYAAGVASARTVAALAPCETGGAEARDNDQAVFLAKLSLASQQIEWIRCVGRWRAEDIVVDLLATGQLLVSAATHPLHLGGSRALAPSLFRSDSRGRTWQSVNAGLGEGRMVTLAVDPTNARIAYASTTDGVKKTLDGGATWRTITPSIWQPYTAISVNPLAPDEVWALGLPASAWSLMRSADGGATWTQLAREYRRGSYNDPPIPFPTVFDAADPTRVWSNRASSVSSDRGATWQQWNSGLAPAGYSGATFVTGSPLGQRYGIAQREGTIDGAFVWGVGDDPWTAGAGRVLDFPYWFAVDDTHPERAFAGSLWKPRVDSTRDGGATWYDLGGPPMPTLSTRGLAAASQPADVETSLLLWGTNERERQPWSTVLFGSNDSGRTWDQRATCAGCTSFVRAPSDPDIVYGFGTSSTSRVFSWWRLDATQVEREVIVPSAGAWDVERLPGMDGVLTGFSADTDDDDDGLPNGWERAYGVEASDPAADPDGDGLSSAQELSAGSHPVGRYVYACAEAGTTDTFATRIDVFNPDTACAARVLLRYATAFDVDARALVYVPAGATRSVELGDRQPGFEGGEHPVLIESDLPLTATRTMTWGTGYLTRIGQHAGGCVPPAPTWHFAEGSTAAGLQVFFVLFNPSALATTVQATFLRTAPQTPITREYALPAGARIVVWANQELLPHSGDFGATFESIDATPIVVERSMYTSSPAAPFFGGGTSANGVVAPARSWWFAEGVNGGGFESYLLLANGATTSSTVRVSYADESGDVVHTHHVVNPQSRLSIRVADEAPAFRTFTTRVDVVDGAAVVAERASWWTTVPGMSWWSAPTQEGHASNGVSDLAASWMVAGGASSVLGFGWTNVYTFLPDTYLLVGKWSDAATTAIVQLHFDDGSVLEQPVALEQGPRRVTVPVQALFGRDTIGQRAFAVTIATADPSALLVVEMSQYRSSTGWWSAGTSMAGTPMVR